MSPILPGPGPAQRPPRSTSRVQSSGRARRRSRSHSSRYSKGRISSPNQHSNHRATSHRADQRSSSCSGGRDEQRVNGVDEQRIEHRAGSPSSLHNCQRTSRRSDVYDNHRASSQRDNQRNSRHSSRSVSNQRSRSPLQRSYEVQWLLISKPTTFRRSSLYTAATSSSAKETATEKQSRKPERLAHERSFGAVSFAFGFHQRNARKQPHKTGIYSPGKQDTQRVSVMV